MSQRVRVPGLLAALIAAVAACEQPLPSAAGAPPPPGPDLSLVRAARGIGGPLPHLSREDRRRFELGSAVFQTVFTPATGLGPLFNGRSCAECHEDPVVGGVGDEVETHQSAFQGGVCNDLAAIGGPVIQDSVTPALHDALGIDKEPPLPEATGTAHRTTPSVLGFGLLEAVPDEVILSHADPDDLDHDGISGRPNRTADGRLGRLGRKAQVATLDEFVSGAFVNEMGITNPAAPNEQTIRDNPLPAGVDPTPDPELSQDRVDATVAFVRFLAPPEQLKMNLVTGERGRHLFSLIGCASCHIPALPTGRSPEHALSHKFVYAFTDLLLHDMGPDLADICLGAAEPSEFRTEPLMGIHGKTAFLHDGRAQSIEQAIELHAGEAAAARERFMGLSTRQRVVLLRYLNSL